MRAAIAGVASSPEHLRATAYARTTLADVTAVLARDLDPARMVVRLTGPMPAVEAAFAALGREPERLPEPAPTRTPTPTPGTRTTPTTPTPTTPTTPPPTDDAPRGEPLAVDHWDEEGERHEGLFLGSKKISLDEFLSVAGAGNLRDRMRDRWWLRIGLLGGGVVVLAGGAGYALTADSCEDVVNLPGPIDEPEVCSNKAKDRRLVGALVAAGGISLVVAANYLSNLAPSKTELRQAASKYNYRNQRRRPATARDVRVTPTTDGQTTGLVLSGTF